MSADTAEARAAYILHGLGFTKQMQQQATKDFSGILSTNINRILHFGLFTVQIFLSIFGPIYTKSLLLVYLVI